VSSKFFRNALLLNGVFSGAASMGLVAQSPKPFAGSHPADIDVAVTYIAERAKIASVDCGCFWLQGGSGNVAFAFFHGLGVAADLTGVHSSNIADGVGLDKIMFAAGPRYAFTPEGWSKRHLGRSRDVSIFGEALFGNAHAFNSVFPSSSGTNTSDSSFAVEIGGGVNLGMTRNVGIRALEVDYLRSTLPNNGNNTQNDLRLGAGLDLHFHLPMKK